MTPANSSRAAISDASRMISYGLKPKARPARDESYLELVKRYRNDDEFADIVKSVAVGLDLVILDVDERHGIVVASTEDSVFAVKMTDYAKRTGGEGKAAERVLHALAHMGAATMAYPRPADLANPAYVGRITVSGVEAFLREATRRLSEAADNRGDDTDPPADSPNLELAWRAFQRRAGTPASGDGRRVSSSTIGMVGKALTFLAEQGMLSKRNEDEGGTYVTTSRYRIQVLEAGQRMFSDLLALGITEVSDGTGTLAVTWTEADIARMGSL